MYSGLLSAATRSFNSLPNIELEPLRPVKVEKT